MRGSILINRSQVHYHIIPAPKSNETAPKAFTRNRATLALTENEMHRLEIEAREDLDEEEADALLQKIHARL